MGIYLQVFFRFLCNSTATCSCPLATFCTWMNAPVKITILLLPISPLLWYLSDKIRNRQKISPWYWRADGLIWLLIAPTTLHLWSRVWDHPVLCSIPRQYSLSDRCCQIQCCKFKFPPSLPHKKDTFKGKWIHNTSTPWQLRARQAAFEVCSNDITSKAPNASSYNAD